MLLLLIVVSSGCATETQEPINPRSAPDILIHEPTSPVVKPMESSTQKSTLSTPAPIEQPKELAYLDFGFMTTIGFDNWDADAENDGIVATIYPHSNDGGDVKVDGTVIFTLYQKKVEIHPSTYEAMDVIITMQEWETKITSEEGGLMGIERRLEFDSKTEALVDSEPFFIGEIRAKLVTSDGKTVEAKTDVIDA
jgi:hypothetical protein